MAFQQQQELLVETGFAVMLLLRADVPFHGAGIRFAHAKRRMAAVKRGAPAMGTDSLFRLTVSLSDGTWRTLLATMRQLRIAASIVVCLRHADGGWVEMLENAAFDLLVEPFATEDVRAVLQRARTVLPQRVLRARV